MFLDAFLFYIILQAMCFSEGGPKASLVLYEMLPLHIDTSWSNKHVFFLHLCRFVLLLNRQQAVFGSAVSCQLETAVLPRVRLLYCKSSGELGTR